MATIRRLRLTRPHAAQQQIIDGSRRFNVVCAGRRFGKSRLGIERCAKPALEGYPVGWFSPTYKMLSELWREMVRTFQPVTLAKSEQEKRLELMGGGVIEMWSLIDNADSVRGRHYARVILDECAIVRNLLDAWNESIRATLIDLRGDAYFFSTPRGRNDFMKLYEFGDEETMPEWCNFHFPTRDNPALAPEEIEDMRHSMPVRAYEQEIEAKFIDEVSGALWRYATIEANRVRAVPDLRRIVVAVDPAGSTNPDSDETGIVAAGVDSSEPRHGYVLADASGTYTPEGWARRAVGLYEALEADCIVAEANFGGDMVKSTLRGVAPTVPVKLVHASRGKAIRAEPIAALDELGRVHHVSILPDLEMQMTTWSPPDDKDSPDRVDARVWALTELMLKRPQRVATSRQA